MKHSLKITLFLVLLFLGAQYIGLAVVNSYIDRAATAQTGNLTFRELPPVFGMQMERPQTEGVTSLVYIISAVLIGTILILLIIRFQKFNIWKVWFFLVVAYCLYVAFYYASQKTLPGAIAGVLGLALAAWKIYKPNFVVHNITELFIYGGLAAILSPILSVWSAAVLLLLISLYDMYAVWRSKHMVTLATAQKSEGVFAGLMIPYSWKGASMQQPVVKHVTKTAAKQGAKPAGSAQTAILGGGDIGFPLLFACAMLQQRILAGASIVPALIIPVFAALGLFGLLIAAKKDRFYPAMPFISIGVAIGWLVSLFF